MSDDELRSESDKERVDRELNELLSELRVALPGVQMLFAFLFTVPFYARFDALSRLPRTVFFATFACTTIAAIFMIAPSSNHRLSFRARNKERLLFRANRFAVAGIAFLAIAICGVVFFITGMVLGEELAPAATGIAGVLIATTWYLSALSRQNSKRQP